MGNSRRDFLKNYTMVSLGFVFLNRYAHAYPTSTINNDIGFGAISHQNGKLLSLPKGFSETIISRKGDIMNDGFFSPGAHDGMGAFRWKNNKVLLIRNHELSPGSHASGPF